MKMEPVSWPRISGSSVCPAIRPSFPLSQGLMVLLSGMPYIKVLMFIFSDQLGKAANHNIYLWFVECKCSVVSLLDAHQGDLITDLVCLVHCVRPIKKNENNNQFCAVAWYSVGSWSSAGHRVLIIEQQQISRQHG